MVQLSKPSNQLINFNVMKQMKKNYALIPIIAVCGFGCLLAAFHSTRILTKGPDVIFNRKGNPTPHQHLMKPDGTGVQYKYFSTLDYSKIIDADRPVSA